jgi:hypothetical protein
MLRFQIAKIIFLTLLSPPQTYYGNRPIMNASNSCMKINVAFMDIIILSKKPTEHSSFFVFIHFLSLCFKTLTNSTYLTKTLRRSKANVNI